MREARVAPRSPRSTEIPGASRTAEKPRRPVCLRAAEPRPLRECPTVSRADVRVAQNAMDAAFAAAGPSRPAPVDRLAPRPFSFAQAELVAVADAYLCAHPADAEVRFAVGQVAFETHQWEAAATQFGSVAFAVPTPEEAPLAAPLYLESLNVLASHLEHYECGDEMMTSVPRLLDGLCRAPFTPGREGLCAWLGRISRDIQELKAAQAARAGLGARPTSGRGATNGLERR